MSNASNTPTPRVSRRTFIATSAAAAASLSAAGRLGAAPEKGGPLRFVQIGCGGQGASDLNNMVGSGAKLIAMCDVDPGRAAGNFKKFADLPRYSDFREMLAKHADEIDAVVVSTPDHMHAVAALAAMKLGKHVYVQKPLARTYSENMTLLDATRKYKVVTQMGNQGHAGAGLKLWKKMMDDKAFGDILELHSWSDRPVWPQGMTEIPKEDAVPEGLDWDSWLGPMAARPYSKAYLPFVWRGWWDFGVGAIGDMACHNMDPAFWTCKLGLPESITAECSAPAGIAYPSWSIVTFKFPATEICPKGIKMTWYDGKKRPAPPAGADPNLNVGGNGCIIVGSEMSAMGGSHAGAPRPIAIGSTYDQEAIGKAEAQWREELGKLPNGNHYSEWVEAASKGDVKAPGSNFEYAAPMSASLALAAIALRFPGKELLWDDKARKFTNHEEANKWIHIDPREGYDLSV
jgi:predicted dehydrogenase